MLPLSTQGIMRKFARPSSITFLFITFQSSLSLAANNGRCYNPNGQLSDFNNYPCDPDADTSPCCGGGFGTYCLTNKLCKAPGGNIIRGACTDQKFASPDCPLYCLDATLGGTDLISCLNVTNRDTSYCCDHTTDCCDTGVARFEVLPSRPSIWATWDDDATQFVVVATSSSTSTSASSTATSTTNSRTDNAQQSGSPSNTQTSPPPQESTSEGSSGLSTGAAAGIGIGGALGALALVGMGFFFYRRRRRSAMNESQIGQDQTMPTAEPQYPSQVGGYYDPPKPVEVENQILAEMPGDSVSVGISEAPGDNRPFHRG